MFSSLRHYVHPRPVEDSAKSWLTFVRCESWSWLSCRNSSNVSWRHRRALGTPWFWRHCQHVQAPPRSQSVTHRKYVMHIHKPHTTACSEKRGQLFYVHNFNHLMVKLKPQRRKAGTLRNDVNLPFYLSLCLLYAVSATDHYTAIRWFVAYTGRVAVDGWAVTFGAARRGLSELRPRPRRPVPSSLYQI